MDKGKIELAVGNVRDQPGFINMLLRDGLDWPVEKGVTKVEDIAYGWSKDDLQIEDFAKHFVDGQVWQIQPLDPGRKQPWGIFLLEFKRPDVFTRGRGITGPLRRILRRLVPKRRQQPNHAVWERKNLLFICTHAYEHFSVAYFKEPPQGGKTAALAIFGWGPDIPSRTAIEFNLPALDWPDEDVSPDQWVANWTSAFDVEKVTEKFFKEYAVVFSEVEAQMPKSLGNGEERRLYTQVLMNRLMFLRFIERKGWLKFGPSLNYLQELFTSTPPKASFYKTRLRRLFFEGLALEEHTARDAIGDVPFLNGGLFEESPLDKKVEDIPNGAFEFVLGKTDGIFYHYNFTVEESTPLDIQVAVDPEMLGKVFEELVTGRHETGSYYTPRPVVSFMCREAIKGHLVSKAGLEYEAVTPVVDKHDVSALNETDARKIIDALDNLKAVDPACGSGAYLLGLLQEMVTLYRLLYSEKLTKDSRSLYELKLRIISNNLYGVDIDPFATNIAMLRLWLSIAVDSDQPLPLPNLDFKIETGDSLLGPCREFQQDFSAYLLEQRAQGLIAKKDEYLRAYGSRKDELYEYIRKEQDEIAAQCHLHYGKDVIAWPVHFAEVFFANTEKLEATFDGKFGFAADQDKQKGLKQVLDSKPGGFDIVLANPPYGLVNKRQNQMMGHALSPEAAKAIKAHSDYGPILRGMVNICMPFIRRSFSLLNPEGVFAEIFPLSFACDQSFSRLRRHVLREYRILCVEAFPERDDPKRRVFASAKMSVCILVARKAASTKEHEFSLRLNRNNEVDTRIVPTQLAIKDIEQFDPDGWSIPLVTAADIRKLRVIYPNSVHLQEIGKCYTGEVDLSLDRQFVKSTPDHATLLKGAIIGRYAIRDSMSQGKIEYLAAKPFLARKGKRGSSKAWHHLKERIVLQGITGINERVRLKMTLIPSGIFCANSANYVLLESDDSVDNRFVLGVLNSATPNYVFKCFSTNSNVNGYEVDNLPIPNASDSEKQAISDLVQKCLDAGGENCEQWEVEINHRVAKLYGLEQRPGVSP